MELQLSTSMVLAFTHFKLLWIFSECYGSRARRRCIVFSCPKYTQYMYPRPPVKRHSIASSRIWREERRSKRYDRWLVWLWSFWEEQKCDEDKGEESESIFNVSGRCASPLTVSLEEMTWLMVAWTWFSHPLARSSDHEGMILPRISFTERRQGRYVFFAFVFREGWEETLVDRVCAKVYVPSKRYCFDVCWRR